MVKFYVFSGETHWELDPNNLDGFDNNLSVFENLKVCKVDLSGYEFSGKIRDHRILGENVKNHQSKTGGMV